MFLEFLNSIIRDEVFLGIYDNANDPRTCDAYRNVSSSETLDETLEMYRKETSNNGLAGILTFLLLCLPLLAALCIIVTAYIISIRCYSGTKTRHKHQSPLITIITKCCGNDTELTDHSHMSYIAGILQCFLAVLYFAGDNLGPVLIAHGGDIGCTGKCSENAAIVTKVMSVGAILLLLLVPYLLHHCVILINHDDWKYELEDKDTLLGLLGNIIKVDAAYTALTGLTIVSNFCSDTEHGLNWTILFISAFTGALYITVKIIKAFDPKQNAKTNLFFISVGIFLTVLLSAYLISDNATPLDCAFHCSDAGPSNGDLTHPLLERHCCNIRNNIITRLSLTCSSIVQTVIIAIVAGVVVLKA